MKEKEKYLFIKEYIQKKNPQLALFALVQEVLGEKLSSFVLDIRFEKKVVWIIVPHPAVIQLLFLKKTAIMSKLRVFSSSLLVKGVRFRGLSCCRKSMTQAPLCDASFDFAPTGEVQGEIAEIENPRLKELLEALLDRTK